MLTLSSNHVSHRTNFTFLQLPGLSCDEPSRDFAPALLLSRPGVLFQKGLSVINFTFPQSTGINPNEHQLFWVLPYQWQENPASNEDSEVCAISCSDTLLASSALTELTRPPGANGLEVVRHERGGHKNMEKEKAGRTSTPAPFRWRWCLPA